MTTPSFQPGSVVFVRPREPEHRHMGYVPHSCWPAVVRRVEPQGGYLGGWWIYLEPCSGGGTTDGTVMLLTLRDNVAQEPCARCLAAWTVAAGWQQMGRAG